MANCLRSALVGRLARDVVSQHMSPPNVALAIESGSNTYHCPIVETREGPGGSLILVIQVGRTFDLGTYRVTIVQGDKRTRGVFSAFAVRAEVVPIRCIGNFWQRLALRVMLSSCASCRCGCTLRAEADSSLWSTRPACNWRPAR